MSVSARRIADSPGGGPRFHYLPVAAITRRDVQQWINTLTRDNLSASTIGDIYRGVFKPVLNKAILDGRLAISPCHRIELPQPVAEEVVPPTPEQILAVIGALPVRYRAMAAIAAGTGARISEAAGITISRLRGAPVRLRIDRQLLSARRGTGTSPGGCRPAGTGSCCRARWGPPKSAAGVRDQLVPAVVASAVAAHLRVCAPAPCGLLFTTPAGTALNLANFRNRVWKPTVRALDGVPDPMISGTPSRRCSMSAASRSGKSPRCSDSPAPARPSATFTGYPTSSWPGVPVSRSMTLSRPAGPR
jgi:integrase